MTERERLKRRLDRNLAAALDVSLPSATRRKRARNAAHFAERLGILCRPDRCASCGSYGPLEKHHTNYALPLAIEWLCHLCHNYADSFGGHIDTDSEHAA